MDDSNDKKIKVTDRRLFTPDGELREEYRDLGEAAPAGTGRSPAEPAAGSDAARTAEKSDAPGAGSDARRPGKQPPSDRATIKPTIVDLIGIVAQPIALYLGDARMPDGESMENLELARLYIDLLEVLQIKTAGNLSQQEARFLEDLLYQLRLRYVEKSKQNGGP